MKMKKDRKVFLVQKSGAPAEHKHIKFEDRSFADEVLEYDYYMHTTWHERRQDKDFGEVSEGDLVLVYFTGNVEGYPKQISHIYEVKKIEPVPEEYIEKGLKEGTITKEKAEELRSKPHMLRLNLHKKLKSGVKRTRIMRGVEQGDLSEGMKKCGQMGFNIGEVEYRDYETILDWSGEATRSDYIDVEEKGLRKYVVVSELGEVLGEEFKDFRLYEDEEGRTGELYDTKVVGEIDLLYENPSTGDFLVIELKSKEDTSDKVVGQISRYMGWVNEHLAEEGETKGLIISRSFSERLKYAVRMTKNIRLFSFKPNIKFNEEKREE